MTYYSLVTCNSLMSQEYQRIDDSYQKFTSENVFYYCRGKGYNYKNLTRRMVSHIILKERLIPAVTIMVSLEPMDEYKDAPGYLRAKVPTHIMCTNKRGPYRANKQHIKEVRHTKPYGKPMHDGSQHELNTHQRPLMESKMENKMHIGKRVQA